MSDNEQPAAMKAVSPWVGLCHEMGHRLGTQHWHCHEIPNEIAAIGPEVVARLRRLGEQLEAADSQAARPKP